jgi:hypothetical protein
MTKQAQDMGGSSSQTILLAGFGGRCAKPDTVANLTYGSGDLAGDGLQALDSSLVAVDACHHIEAGVQSIVVGQVIGLFTTEGVAAAGSRRLPVAIWLLRRRWVNKSMYSANANSSRRCFAHQAGRNSDGEAMVNPSGHLRTQPTFAGSWRFEMKRGSGGSSSSSPRER